MININSNYHSWFLGKRYIWNCPRNSSSFGIDLNEQFVANWTKFTTTFCRRLDCWRQNHLSYNWFVSDAESFQGIIERCGFLSSLKNKNNQSDVIWGSIHFLDPIFCIFAVESHSHWFWTRIIEELDTLLDGLHELSHNLVVLLVAHDCPRS